MTTGSSIVCDSRLWTLVLHWKTTWCHLLGCSSLHLGTYFASKGTASLSLQYKQQEWDRNIATSRHTICLGHEKQQGLAQKNYDNNTAIRYFLLSRNQYLLCLCSQTVTLTACYVTLVGGNTAEQCIQESGIWEGTEVAPKCWPTEVSWHPVPPRWQRPECEKKSWLCRHQTWTVWHILLVCLHWTLQSACSGRHSGPCSNTASTWARVGCLLQGIRQTIVLPACIGRW